MPWAGPPAIIVADFGANPQAYSDRGKPQGCPRPEKCLKCQVTGSLIGHGYYHRKPKDPAAGVLDLGEALEVQGVWAHLL